MKRIALITAIICTITGEDFAQAGRAASSSYSAPTSNYSSYTRSSGSSYSAPSSNYSAPSQSYSAPGTNYSAARSAYSGSASYAAPGSGYQQSATFAAGPTGRSSYGGENYNATNPNYSGAYRSYASTSSPMGSFFSYHPSPGVTSGYLPAVSGGGGVAARYNYVVRNTYPCYSTSTTRDKSHRHLCDRPRIGCEPLLPFDNCSNIPYYYMFCCCDYFYNDYLFYDDHSNTAHATEPVTLDGYIIYYTDTLSGLLTMDKKFLSLEPGMGQKGFYTTVQYSDNNLKDIVLYMGNNELHLTRLSVNDKRLSRELHTGKLNIYDNRYIFPTPGNINTADLKVCFAGHVTIIKIRNKKQLVESLNTAYGVHLKAKDYTWAQLLAYIDTLE